MLDELKLSLILLSILLTNSGLIGVAHLVSHDENKYLSKIYLFIIFILFMYFHFIIYLFIYMQQTAEEWRNVFFVCFGFNILGIIIYALFASGEVQTWATDGNIEFVVEIDEKKPGLKSEEKPTNTVILNGVENKAFENEKQTETVFVSGIESKTFEIENLPFDIGSSGT